jgi:hypothetical protein
MNTPKASKRNLRKKLSRYTKKVKLTIEKEITNIDVDKDNKDNLSYEEKTEIFYDPNKVS